MQKLFDFSLQRFVQYVGVMAIVNGDLLGLKEKKHAEILLKDIWNFSVFSLHLFSKKSYLLSAINTLFFEIPNKKEIGTMKYGFRKKTSERILKYLLQTR